MKKKSGTWTRFFDMYSGGGLKEPPYEHIYIEAPKEEACVIFYNRFGHSPTRVSCACCGDDYSISTDESLRILTAYDRGCKWDEESKTWLEKAATGRTFQSLRRYVKRKDVLVIRGSDIKKNEREGTVPEQGFVWVD